MRRLPLPGARTLACALILAAANSALAQSLPRLLNVFPPGGKAGTTVTVAVSGQDLEGAGELQFARDGIVAEHAGSNCFQVTIAPGVPVGVYDARAVGTNGASNPRGFAVGTLDEVIVEKASTSADAPNEIPLEATINGRAEANAVQHFRVAAKKGQRVLARCSAADIDSRLEPVLAVMDTQGREIGRNRFGGVLDFTPEADGTFVIKVHDVIYRGGTDFPYRLSVGTFPHVDLVFPPAVVPGKNKLTVFGRNLPGATAARDMGVDGRPLDQCEIEVDVPAARANDGGAGSIARAWHETAELVPVRIHPQIEPVLLSLARTNIVAEIEPNNTGAEAQKISVPCDIVGSFDRHRDHDWFTFDAGKGDVLWMELVSHRLGFPTDPLVVLQRVSGDSVRDLFELNDSDQNLGGADFDTRHRDPAAKVEIMEDGTYRILVRNLFTTRASDGRSAYHLSVRRPMPDFRLVTLPQAPPPAKKEAKDILLVPLQLRRGETSALKVVALRRDGFVGAIDLEIDALPPGVTAAPARIETGKTSTLLLVTADASVPPSHAPITIRGRAEVGDAFVSRSARAATLVWSTPDPGADAAVSRLASDMILSLTTGIPPVRVSPSGSNVLEAIAGGKATIPFDVVRDDAFTGALKLKPAGVAALDSIKEMEVAANATNAVLEIDLAQQKLGPGRYTFALQGSAQLKEAKPMEGSKPREVVATFYSAPVILNVSAAETAKKGSP